MERRTKDRADRSIADRGMLACAMTAAQRDHPAANHLVQVKVNVIGQIAQSTEELHDRPHFRVVHCRQVDQALDRPPAEGPAHLLIDFPHLFRR